MLSRGRFSLLLCGRVLCRSGLDAAHVRGHPVVELPRVLRLRVGLEERTFVANKVGPDFVREELHLPEPDVPSRDVRVRERKPCGTGGS